MNPLPLQVPPQLGMNPGDIVTIEGMWNRPPMSSLAWWAMFLLGPEFACRHLGWCFRRKASDPFYHVSKGRRRLLKKRVLQPYVIDAKVN